MNNSVIIRCANCKTLNKVSKAKIYDKPICGNCKKYLVIYDKPVEATDADFNEHVINAGSLVVVDFYAPWCGPCKQFAPVFKDFASKHAGELKAVKVNTEQNRSISAKYGIQSIPTLILFKDGKEIQRVSGALPQPQLENLVAPYL